MPAEQMDDVDTFREAWRRELPKLDTSPMAVLGRINRIAAKTSPAISAVFDRHGLERGEFDVISTLRRSGPPYTLSPTDLYRTLMITSGGLTHRLARLEKAGLIIREPSAADRRSLLVRLTESGSGAVEAAFAEDMALERDILDTLPEDRREALAALLRDLLRAIEAKAG
ncbi:MarR family transcriptional regulator [Glycocaulis profundi]|nr:MarR family transcriptional regulator [Glycocaulis profundi]